MKRRTLDKKLANFILLLIPIIILFDWLMTMSIINIQVGLYLKALATLIFLWIIFKNKSNSFYFKKNLLFFLSLFIIYSIFSTNYIENLYFTSRIAYWILGAIAFYIFFRKGLITSKGIRKMFIITTLIAGIFTLVLMNNSDEHQNASAYLLLWCTPLLLFFKKKSIVKFVIALAIISIILTIKRGAIIALLISLFFYFLADAYIKRSLIKRVKVIFSALLITLVASLVLISQWDIISLRLEDKGGSGRDIMYQLIIDDYIDSKPVNILLGHGINSVQELTASRLSGDPNSVGVAAHSDWLQNAYDFGVLGILFMILMHIQLIKIIRFLFKNKSQLFPSIVMLYTIFFLTSIYAFILSTPEGIFLGITLAYISAERVKILNQNKSEALALII